MTLIHPEYKVGDRVRLAADETDRRTGVVTEHRLQATGLHQYRVRFDGQVHDSDWITHRALLPRLEPATATLPALNEGDFITVVYGKQVFAPKPYMNFTVGPLSATTTIRAGETAEEAHARVWAWLEAQARTEFKAELAMFRQHLTEI